jgi:hypothetical protein
MDLMLLKLRAISISVIPILLAIILHEISHGWVADRLGDSTARYSGRLTARSFCRSSCSFQVGLYSAMPNPSPSIPIT